MNLLRWLSTAVLVVLVGGCQTKRELPTAEVLPLIPQPVSVVAATGSFPLRTGTHVVVRGGDAQSTATARYFAELVRQSRSLRLDVEPSGNPGPGDAIEFVLDRNFHIDADDHGEGYVLDVGAHRITLSAATPHGLFNAAVTLWQLMTAQSAPAPEVRVPALHIVDYPRFAWRGLLLDSARHFQSPEFVKRFIDEMALHKLNVLHWHLTDDQGWRIEIRKYPKLTEIGAWRAPQPDEMQLADPATGRYGGFYTQAQIRDIVAYAAARYVTIVPEIDMPGHAQAAIASYPRLGVTGKQPPVSSDWGINTYLYNVEESTFAFINDVLGEVLELFPSPYIHVGGDEAAKDQWQASARVQERMRRLGVHDEKALQGYFTARLEGFLRAHGRKLIGWDEILEGGLPPGAVVMSWRGAEGAVAAATQGDDVVMAPDPSVYLDHLQGNGRDEPPGRVKVLSLADMYAFEPVPKELDAGQARHILGAQANLWSEYLTTGTRVEFAAFPRAAALAEKLWSPPARTNWNDFLARLPAQFERYRAYGTQFSDSAFAPQASVSALADGRFRVNLAKQLEYGSIHYTLDGSAPTPRSPVYREPLAVKADATLGSATFAGDRQLATPRSERIDAARALRRYSNELRTCGDSLLLRLEGAPVGTAPAPLYNVDLMNPCWIYPQVDFDATARIDVQTGALPYFFELWHDTDKVVMHAPGGPADELQLHLDGCDGPLIAGVPLSADRNALRTVNVPVAGAGRHDVCAYFASRAHDPLRLIEWIEPVTRGR
jgi:hexosaminidase